MPCVRAEKIENAFARRKKHHIKLAFISRWEARKRGKSHTYKLTLKQGKRKVIDSREKRVSLKNEKRTTRARTRKKTKKKKESCRKISIKQEMMKLIEINKIYKKGERLNRKKAKP